jgi:hypothetical protein
MRYPIDIVLRARSAVVTGYGDGTIENDSDKPYKVIFKDMNKKWTLPPNSMVYFAILRNNLGGYLHYSKLHGNLHRKLNMKYLRNWSKKR